LGLEWSGRRHLEAAVTINEALDELAFGGVADVDHRAVIAAPKSVLTLVETKSGLLDFIAVAGVAFLGEDGLDVFFEINFPIGGRGEIRCG
jgi:hypothetical protein